MKFTFPLAKLLSRVQNKTRSKRPDRNRLRRLLIERMEDRRVLATIDLAALTASQGTTIFGADAGDYSGVSVSNAGDMNGDGFDDLVVGASRADASGNTKTSSGESYVIFGAAILPATIDLASLGSAGITIWGVDAGDMSGSVSSAGDVNGDGFDDLLIGARNGDASGNSKIDAGESYLIFGAASLPATIDLANLGSAGTTILGIDANDGSGISVSCAGDINGDGFHDIAIGAWRGGNAGESYVIFGAAALPATIDLANLGSAGITIFGVDAADYSGHSLSSAGDVNGDGFDDLIIGAFNATQGGNFRAGESYVLFGATTLPSTVSLRNLGAAGVRVFGAGIDDNSGFSVSNAGDFNGDGFDDLVIGADWADGPGYAKPRAGESYLIFGATTLPTTIQLSNLGSAGITFFGAEASDFGGIVSGAGDVNGDGFDDLVIGARAADGLGNSKLEAGESYVIFGGTSFPTTIDLANIGSSGLTIFGADSADESGKSVSNAGDVNGDGFDDLLIGATGADAAGNAKSASGEIYLIYGNNFTASITHQGTSAADTLTGTVATNLMNGGMGNDTLVGNGGGDILIGGQGNDVLAVGDLSFKRVVGGTGNDTLRLDGSGLFLDLTTLRDNRILGIEQIDISGTGINTLTLNPREVLNISDDSNTLIVRRNLGDIINIGNGWTQGADETIGLKVFSVYTQGEARLKVQFGNQAPTDILLSDNSIAENAAVSSTIGVFSTSDQDTEDTFTYSLVSGSGATDNGAFTISVNQLQSNAVFDFETKKTYSIRVRTTDIGGVTFEKAFTINVSDVNEAPGLSLTNVLASVPESNTTGLDIANVVITDDALGTNTITLSGPDATMFQFSAGKLKLKPSSLDFETKPTLRVTISVDDPTVGSTPDQAIDVVLNVTDVNEAPGLLLTNLVLSVSESNTAGQTIADVTVKDDALGASSITLSGPDSAMFEVSAGKLKLKPSSLDFETKPTLRVTISVDDPTVGSTPDQAIDVVLNVTDVNEAPGVTLTNLVTSVPESNTAGLSVVDIAINDDALGANTITLSGPDVAKFEVSGGKLKLKPSSLDFETKPTLRVTVSVDDPTVGLTPDQAVDIVLNVTDVNEAPGFTLTSVVSSVVESNSISVNIADIVLRDDALGANTVSLTGLDAGLFQVVGSKLVLKPSSLDFETKPTLRVTVSVDDPTVGNSPDQSTDVVLNVTDVNEAPTDVVFSNVLLQMAEESTLQQAITVADISVTDDALGTNELSLRGVDAQYFEITNNKLVLKAGARFNFEAQSIFQVRVTAIDPSLTDSTPVFRDYVLNIDNVPEVIGVAVVDGQGWNDSVRQVRILFDTLVNLTNSAIEWSKKDIGGASVPIVVQTSVVNNRTVADVRFQGKYVDAVGLLDGSYDLLVRGDQVTVAATGIPGLTYTESFLAVRPKPTFAMNITLAPSVTIGAVTSLAVQLVGANGTGIRYDIDLDGDGVIDRTITSGTAITLNDVVFTHGGSRTVQVTATRNGVTLGRNSAVIDVVPYTVRGSRWLSTLDVDGDETVSPLDVLGVINWLNDTSSDRRYALNLDVDRDSSISPLDVLAIINHINVEGSGTSPTPFVSLAMNDSGDSDGLTDNVGIQGRAKETNARLFLSLDGSPRREAVGAIGADGAFDLTDAAIAQLFGSSLEGDHLLTIGAVGSDGSWRGMDRRFSRTSRSLNPFELTTALQNGGLSLAWTSAGSGSRYRVMQSIAGQSPAVLADGLVVLSTRIDLPIGIYDVFIEAYDTLGRKQSSPIVRVRIV